MYWCEYGNKIKIVNNAIDAAKWLEENVYHFEDWIEDQYTVWQALSTTVEAAERKFGHWLYRMAYDEMCGDMGEVVLYIDSQNEFWYVIHDEENGVLMVGDIYDVMEYQDKYDGFTFDKFMACLAGISTDGGNEEEIYEDELRALANKGKLSNVYPAHIYMRNNMGASMRRKVDHAF